MLQTVPKFSVDLSGDRVSAYKPGVAGSGAHRTGVRRCAGCRQPDHYDALLRFVLDDSEVPELVVDLTRSRAGRGVSVHPRWSCIQKAAQRGAFARGFKRRVEADASVLRSAVREQLHRQLDRALIRSLREGTLRCGEVAVRDALGEVRVLVLAGDRVTSGGRLASIRRCIVHRDTDTLNALLGRRTEGVLGIVDQHIADDVCKASRRVDALEASADTERNKGAME